MNPVLQRELAGILRSNRTFWMQLVFTGALIAIVLVRWPSDSVVDSVSTQSREVFRLFAYALLTLLLLIVPAFPAVSIVKEKSNGTMQLLLNSPMSSWSIYLGKFGGTVLFVAWLLLLSLPALAACLLMGGLSLRQEVLPAYLLLIVMAVNLCSMALLVSSKNSSSDSALRITYGIVVCLSVVTLVPNLFLQGQEGSMAVAAEYLRCVSPIAAMLELSGQQAVMSRGIPEMESIFARYLIFVAVSSLGCGLATVYRLNHRLVDRARAQGRITNEQSLGTRLIRRALFVVDPRRRSLSLGGIVNPVLIKEFRARRFGRMHWILRFVAACAVVSVGVTYVSAQGTQAWGVETVGGIMVMLQVALILLLMPAISAVLISNEVESGGWTLLKMTPLWITRIVTGKLASALIPAALILLGTLPGYLILVWIEPAMEWQVRRVLVSLILAAVMSVLVGAAVSSIFHRTAQATAISYGILLAMMGGTFLIWLGRDAPFGHSFVEFMLAWNPVAAAMSDMRTPGFAEYRLTPINWWICGSISVFSFVVLCARTWRLSRPE